MSKCDLAIEFDRPNRLYQAGEQVKGKALVQVNQDVNCRAFTITGSWQTHGKGNRDKADYCTITLAHGHWRAGQQMEFPFVIDLPHYPLTYHGTNLNVDHYLRLQVDLPWAFDPKLEEEFIVAPAAGGHYDVVLPIAHAAGNTLGNSGKTIIVIVGVIFTLVGLCLGIPTMGFGLLFAAVGLAILFFTFRSQLAERKLGPVSVSELPVQVFPNTTLPFTVSFTPKAAGLINAITLTLQCNEICISGSGSNRRTHTHSLWNQPSRLLEAREFTKGDTVNVAGEIQIPPNATYSANFTQNRVEWKTTVHIDIAKWPDWIQEQLLKVVPASDMNQTLQISSEVGDYQQEFDAESQPVTGPSSQFIPPVIIPAGTYDRPAAPVGSPQINMRSDLISVVQRFQRADRFSGDVEKILEEIGADLFEIQAVIDRINRSYGYFEDPRYAEGMTVMGTLAGTDVDVSIQLPAEYNQQLENLGHGAVWSGSGVVIKWDPLYERLELMAF
jgi:hypothetical protein